MSVHQLLYVFILGLVLLISGCSKQESPNNAANAAANFTWSPESINNLLPYVPWNTPFLMASTHNFDSSNGVAESIAKPVLTALLSQFTDVDSKIEEAIQNRIDKNNGDKTGKMQKVIKTELNNTIHLLRNFRADAQTWGLHADGRDDFIIYITQSTPVMKFTTENVETFKKRMNTNGIFAKLATPDILAEVLQVKELNFNNDTWTVYDITPILCYDYNQGRNSELEPVCKRSADEHHYAAAVAIHYGKDNIVTTTLLLDAKDSVLPQLLNKASEPMTTAMLPINSGNIHDFTCMKSAPLTELVIGRLTQMVQPQAMEDEELSKSINAMRTWSNQYPSANILTLLNGKEIIFETQLEVADHDSISAIHNMTTGTREFSPDIIAGLQISANLQKLSEILLQKLNDADKNNRKVSQMSQNLDELKSFITPVDAIHLEIKKLIFSKDNIEFDGKFSLYGNDIKSLTDTVYSMFGASGPALNTPGTFRLIDTSEMFSSPINEVLKESEYAVASPSYDLNVRSAVTGPDTLLDLIIKVPAVKIILSRYNIFYHNRGICHSINISDDACDKLPARFLDLFDDKAGMEITASSTEKVITYQVRYDFSVK